MTNMITVKGITVSRAEMLSAPSGKSAIINSLVAIPPMPCIFNKGDIVTYTNDYGVSFTGIEIIGFGEPIEGRPESFIYLNSESWWCPVASTSLTLEKRYKSESAAKVLMLMDSHEYESKSYSYFVKRIADENGISIEQLERELQPFI